MKFGGVGLYVPTTTIVICVQLVHKSLVAHGSNPQHSKRQPNYDCLVAFIIFMRTHPNPLLSKTQLVNVGYETPLLVPSIYTSLKRSTCIRALVLPNFVLQSLLLNSKIVFQDLHHLNDCHNFPLKKGHAHLKRWFQNGFQCAKVKDIWP